MTETYETVLKTLIKINHTFPRGEKIDGSRLREYFKKREYVSHTQLRFPIHVLITSRYTVAFVDFFDDEFQREDGDWKKVLSNYLYEQDKPLMNGLIGGCTSTF